MYLLTLLTPTKSLNAQQLVEYQKQFLQEENQKSGNVMQHTLHSYVCGINLRSESSLNLTDLHRCTRIRQECVYRAKSKYDLMRILSELVFIPQKQESIGCCMTFPDFLFSS